MKLIIESEDNKEIQRFIKSLDMACVLFDITKNLHRKFDADHSEVFEAIAEMMESYGIDIDELIE